MILFDLRCSAGHLFEGWFRDGAAFEAQARAGEIACPVCGVAAVVKAPMAPRLGRTGKEATERPAPAEAPATGQAPTATGARPDGAALLAALRRHVAENYDYVGERFPEEARKIHYGEAESRPIYGEASQSEARELAEEGVPVALIPDPAKLQ